MLSLFNCKNVDLLQLGFHLIQKSIFCLSQKINSIVLLVLLWLKLKFVIYTGTRKVDFNPRISLHVS